MLAGCGEDGVSPQRTDCKLGTGLSQRSAACPQSSRQKRQQPAKSVQVAGLFLQAGRSPLGRGRFCPPLLRQQTAARPNLSEPRVAEPVASVTDKGDFLPPASHKKGSWAENPPFQQDIHSASAVVVGLGAVAW